MSLSPNHFKDAARGISVDMSPEAIAQRVRIMDQLWKAAQQIKGSVARIHEPLHATK